MARSLKRSDDQRAYDSLRKPMPRHVRPMLAKPAQLPDESDLWAFEVKWDGIRAIIFVEGGRLRIETRNLNDVTNQYPEFAQLGRELGSHEAVLDGEIVAFDEYGRASFQTLQSRLGLTLESTIHVRARQTPAHFAAFDLLYLNGRDLRTLPYLDRRRLLRKLLDDGPSWSVPAHYIGGGTELLDAVAEQGLEGIVAKRVDSAYREDSRSGAWLKVKRQQRQEFVICGWTEGQGRRLDSIGALLLAYHDDDQRLIYAGSVGTGFSDALLKQLHEQLVDIEVEGSPLDEAGPDPTHPGKWKSIRGPKGQVHYARPVLVAEVEFTEFTRDGTLRHPSFKGLRSDKPAEQVVREDR